MAQTHHPISRIAKAAVAVIMAFALCLPIASLAYAGEPAPEGPEPRMADTAAIIKDGAESITASSWANHQNDLFAGVDPHEITLSNTVDVNFDLDYDPSAGGAHAGSPLAEGDTLTLALKPVGDTPDMMRVYYAFIDVNKEVELSGNKIADLVYPDNRAMKFTFVSGLDELAFRTTAPIHLSWQVDQDVYKDYFKRNPAASQVELEYQLYVNGAPVEGKTLKLLVKNGMKPVSPQFVKTSGHYNKPQLGDVSFGSITYSIYTSTLLNTNNEFVYYDTPDINQSFEGDFDIAVTESYKGGGSALWLENGNHYKSIFPAVSPAAEPMEVWLYDIYYTTEDPEQANEPRMSGYKDETLVYSDRLVQGAPYASDAQAAVPENILVEKLSGEALTAEEQATIDAAGGLHKTVGKGFKVRIKNFHGAGVTADADPQGGFITMTYTMDVVNNSPVMDESGNPVFSNTASYYGQEIPIAPGNPVRHEGSTLDAVIKGETTGVGVVKPGDIVVDGETWGVVNFTKLAEPAKDAAEGAEATPLAGACFTVYSVAKDGARTVAANKAGVELKDLVTNADGKLCTAGTTTPVDLTLAWGNYVFVETSAPEGYEIEVAESRVAVGFVPSEVTVVNTPEVTDPGNPGGGEDPDPDNPGGDKPTDPDPDEPGGGDNPGGGENPGPDNPGEGNDPGDDDDSDDTDDGAGDGSGSDGGNSDDNAGSDNNAGNDAANKGGSGGTLAQTGDETATLALLAFAGALGAAAVAAIARTRRNDGAEG